MLPRKFVSIVSPSMTRATVAFVSSPSSFEGLGETVGLGDGAGLGVITGEALGEETGSASALRGPGSPPSELRATPIKTPTTRKTVSFTLLGHASDAAMFHPRLVRQCQQRTELPTPE
jgi:hypothetical protein